MDVVCVVPCYTQDLLPAQAKKNAITRDDFMSVIMDARLNPLVDVAGLGMGQK